MLEILETLFKITIKHNLNLNSKLLVCIEKKELKVDIFFKF